jgi:hypothetical protein
VNTLALDSESMRVAREIKTTLCLSLLGDTYLVLCVCVCVEKDRERQRSRGSRDWKGTLEFGGKSYLWTNLSQMSPHKLS